MFEIEVLYSQIAVYWSKLEEPFNAWTAQHVDQGFSWRPGSVSFRSLVESGPHSIEVKICEHAGDVSPGAVRAIEVPFEVPDDGAVEVGSIIDSVPLNLPVGSYRLRCEFLGPREGIECLRLIFSSADPLDFALSRIDAGLSPGDVLVTTAEAAV